MLSKNDDIGHRFKQNRNQFLFFQKGEPVPLFERNCSRFTIEKDDPVHPFRVVDDSVFCLDETVGGLILILSLALMQSLQS